jgi:hypothetical protein
MVRHFWVRTAFLAIFATAGLIAIDNLIDRRDRGGDRQEMPQPPPQDRNGDGPGIHPRLRENLCKEFGTC